MKTKPNQSTARGYFPSTLAAQKEKALAFSRSNTLPFFEERNEGTCSVQKLETKECEHFKVRSPPFLFQYPTRDIK